MRWAWADTDWDAHPANLLIRGFLKRRAGGAGNGAGIYLTALASDAVA